MEHDSCESNPDKPSPSSPSSSSTSPPNNSHSSHHHLHSFSISRLHHSHLRRSSVSPSSMPISLTTTSSTSPNHSGSGNSSLINSAHNLSIQHHSHHHHQQQSLQAHINNMNNNNNMSDNSRSPPASLTPQSFSSPSARRLSSGLSCVVCGDTSSGKHYGILACNGCSGFFKRSVRRKLIYRCQAGTGTCIVDKAHRNQCQACRLKKCLNMGMNKDAVQNERQPRNTATLRPEAFCEMDQERALREAAVAVGVFGPLLGPRGHGALAVCGGGAHHLSGGSYHQPPPPPMILSSAQSNESINGIRDDDEDSIDVTSDDNIPVNHSNNSNPNPHNKSSTPICNGGNRAATNGSSHSHASDNNRAGSDIHNNNTNNGNANITNNGIPPHSTSINFSGPNTHPGSGINSGPRMNNNNNSSSTTSTGSNVEIPSATIYNHQETIYETSARLLFMAVKWAKNLPSFGSLPFRDQVILLEEAWSDLFLLNAIQWCMPGDSVSLFSTTDHVAHLPNGKAVQVAGDLRNLNDALLRFRAIGVDPAEFACLKAIALFKSDTRGLKDPLQVENLQDQAQVMLCQHSRGQHPTHPARFGRLLLMLPLLRLVSPQRIEFLFFQRTIGNTPMEKVLCDMYKN